MPEERRHLIEKYLSSNLTQREFIARENIKLSTFTYWLKKYRSRQIVPVEAESFITIEPKADKPTAVPGFPSGLSLRIY